MLNEIKQSLIKQSEEENITIFYACESGSRAWGFPSPDSDYDVRFIYAHPRNWYLSLFEERDVIEQPINDLLDISGWDIQKALHLLYKSNGPLIEWLHSPVIYTKDSEVLNKLRELAVKNFQPLGVCHHYLGMAKKGWDAVSDKENVKLKRYFYTLRALLCCEWIINEKSIPPVEFRIILEKYYPSGDFRDAVDKLLVQKSKSNESDKIIRSEYKSVLDIVDNRITELMTSMPGKFPTDPEKVDRKFFNNTFREILESIQERKD